MEKLDKEPFFATKYTHKNLSIFLGTAFINAVFFGVKLDSGVEPPDSLIGAPREAACSSSASIAIPLNTRKHVLQVSTYQVRN